MQHVLAVLGYVVATFATQALSHFVVFKAHYEAVPFNTPKPNFVFGLTSTIIQGAVISIVYANSQFAGQGLIGALILCWLFGAFLVSYLALAEPAKYTVPNVGKWVAVETLSGAVQFTLAGLLLWLAHQSVG